MNAPFKNILLATEHSDFDRGAERFAFEMAQRCQMPLAGVLPIASNPEFEAVAPQLAAKADAEAALCLRELESAASAAGIRFSCEVRRGAEMDQEIVQEARARNSDLIVARRRGKRGFFAKLLVGEMVSRVVAHAPCSVLLVPQASAWWSRKVLVALDPRGQAANQRFQIRVAVGIAAECGLPLMALVVLGDPQAERAAGEQLLDLVRQATDAQRVPLDAQMREGKPFEQIIACAQASGADLIVLGRHSGPLTGRAWLGSTTQKVIGLAERPVLVAIEKLENTP